MKNGIIHRLLDRLLKKREIINCDRDIYLHRWFLIRNKWIGVYVHKFVRSDEDRALHDHPWSFLVVPIWRGYIEHGERKWMDGQIGKPVARRVYPIIGTRFRKATYRHRVELLWDEKEWRPKPSWSLFFRFTKFREWGFWPKEGFVKWNKWWQDKCGGDDL